MNENQVDRESGLTINMRELWVSFLRQWGVIAICAVLVAAISFVITFFFVTPKYQASVSIYVNNNRVTGDKDYVTNSDLSASQHLVNSYMSITKSNRILEKVSERLDGKYSVAQLKNLIQVRQVSGTEIFVISVIHPKPVEAALIANAAAEIAPVEVAKLIEGSSAQLIDTAQVPTSRHSPSYSRNILLGAAAGMLAAVAYLTIAFLKDTRIKDENDLSDMFKLPVLGRIPDFAYASSSNHYSYEADREETEGIEE